MARPASGLASRSEFSSPRRDGAVLRGAGVPAHDGRAAGGGVRSAGDAGAGGAISGMVSR